MAETIPPPPYVAPLIGVTSGAADPNTVVIRIFRWNESNFDWDSIDFVQVGWQFWPSGYYASSHQGIDGNADWGPNSVAWLVIERKDPEGIAQPYTIPDPISADGTSASAQCPTGLALSAYTNPYVGNPVPMCNWIPTAPINSCPDGTVWDPSTETCKPIGLPPPLPIPLPPPSPPDSTPDDHPDPDGDEITQTLCRQLWAQANAIITAIQGIGGSPGSGDDQIDQLLINALITLNSTLDTFQTFLQNLVAGGGGANADPVTCAQLTAQFDKLIAAINGGDPPVNATPPIAPADFVPTPYTAADALRDVETLKDSMPFVGPVTQ